MFNYVFEKHVHVVLLVRTSRSFFYCAVASDRPDCFVIVLLVRTELYL